MNLHNVREELAAVIESSGLTQVAFAAKHGISYSYLNKFLCEHQDNPRFNSILKIQEVIAAEQKRKRAVA